ncbi:ABC transporter permease [Tepidimicrobium xylanilyticum]|uniref:NitT/TauT family transport system permease protein n=1 Tax=Tepidimicrobium xylanilyticum TaxID=1123352 RepID=A0A1H2ZGV0_9FIRM|nr:ABC transporter permease subunit [Tepidimicrobium xylanilyticum]GMG96486.1 ABC transporter permease [Tepidimicrobium xylanilyticum]SDX16680.1 NitT/TauT family transport system permease protein [Tepidimicrobium xylanilyticum]
MENVQNLTREDILKLEAKSKSEKILDYIIALSPTLFGIIHLLEYLLVPNYGINKHTTTYAYFIGLLITGVFFFFIGGLSNKKIFAKLRFKAPFYSFVFLLLMTYDYLTLKTGILILPYFPWVDLVINAAWADRVYLLDCVKNSLILLFTGYFIGAIIGLVTGILSGYNKKVHYWIAPFMKLLGPIPSTTWIPVVMVIASSLFKGAVFIIALGVWFSVTLATMTGIHNVNNDYFDAAKTLGAKNTQLVTRIALPAALPNILQGLIQGMSSACTALLVAEMLGVESGLGWYISWQKSWAEYSKMYAAIIIICITFIIVNWILTKVKRTVIKWKEEVT